MKVYGGDDDDAEKVSVGLAEYAVVEDGHMLTSSGLGSCVAVAIRDPETAVGGLLHFMLPSSAEIDDDTPAKFADSGLDEMLTSMDDAGADRGRLEAKIVGGANMLDLSEQRRLIGTRNVRAAREKLEAEDVPIVSEDTGGDHGRSIVYDPQSGVLRVRGPGAEDERI